MYEARLHQGNAVTKLHTGPIPLLIWAHFLAHWLGLKVYEL